MPEPGGVLRFGPFAFDEARGDLRRDGAPVEIQATPLRLLRYLVEHPGDVLSRDELLDHVWDGVAVSDGAISTALNQVRRTLGDRDREPPWIETLRGRGIRFSAAVEREGPDAAAAFIGLPQGHPGTASRFVGRRALLTRIGSAFEASLAGRGRIVLLAGDAGIGKTRTAEVFSEHVHTQGVPLHMGWCYESAGAPPYWPWVQVLRQLVEDPDDARLSADLGVGAADVAQLVPELRKRLPDLPEPPRGEGADARFRLFDGVCGFLERVAAHKGLVLHLEDLHWADASSLRLLEFVAHEIPRAPILLLASYRDLDVGPEHVLNPSLAQLARHDWCERERLEGLLPEEIRELAEGTFGGELSQELIDGLVERTGGNPLFVRELVRLYQADPPARAGPHVPPGVRDVIRGRLGGLSPPAREALAMASVIGREFALDLLGEVSGLAREVATELEPARRAGIVQASGPGRYAFTHPLVWESVVSEPNPARRAELHARVGAALEDRYGAEPGPHLAALAHHFREAASAGGAAEKAIEYEWLAGEHASRALAFEEAAEHYARALELLEQGGRADPGRLGRLLLDLAGARRRAGAEGEAAAVCGRALALARSHDDAELFARAVILLRLPAESLHSEHYRRVALYEEALRRLGEREPALRSRLLSDLSFDLRFTGDLESQRAASAASLAIARSAGDPDAQFHALDCELLVRSAPDTLEERRAICDEMIELARREQDLEKEFRSRSQRLTILFELADAEAIDCELPAYTELADRARQPSHRAAALRAQATRATWRGELSEAHRLIEVGRALEPRRGGDVLFDQFSGSHSLLNRFAGRAEEHLAQTRAGAERFPRMLGTRAGLAQIYVDMGRESEARQEFESLDPKGFGNRPGFTLAYNLSVLAEVCAYLGDHERAPPLYELLAPFAGRYATMETLVALGCASRYLGLLATVVGRWDAAARHFEEALEVERRMRARPWEGYALHDYARMRLARGSPGDREVARELAGEALEIARSVGLKDLEEKARRLRLELRGVRMIRGRG